MADRQDLLTPPDAEALKAQATALWCRSLAGQARLLLDHLETARQRAIGRGDEVAAAPCAAQIAVGLAYERALMRRAGGPDVDYAPKPITVDPR